MQKIVVSALMLLIVATNLAQSQTATKQDPEYQVATITAVRPHRVDSKGNPAERSYEVTLNVKGTSYTVLYTDPSGTGVIKYRHGLSVLVVIEDDRIIYNNLVGESISVPIIGRESAAGGAKPTTPQ